MRRLYPRVNNLPDDCFKRIAFGKTENRIEADYPFIGLREAHPVETTLHRIRR